MAHNAPLTGFHPREAKTMTQTPKTNPNWISVREDYMKEILDSHQLLLKVVEALLKLIEQQKKGRA
jgi:hypothetical protein